MTNIKLDNTLLQFIDISYLSSYLEKHGWKQSEHPNDRIILFKGPLDNDGEPIDLVIPKNKSFGDSYRRLAEALDVLSIIEKRPANEILNEILGGKSSRSLAWTTLNPFQKILWATTTGLTVSLVIVSIFLLIFNRSENSFDSLRQWMFLLTNTSIGLLLAGIVGFLINKYPVPTQQEDKKTHGR
ncbi:MAG: hypothetical protein AB1489_14165 [Acidobacteriota bacterium]